MALYHYWTRHQSTNFGSGYFPYDAGGGILVSDAASIRSPTDTVLRVFADLRLSVTPHEAPPAIRDDWASRMAVEVVTAVRGQLDTTPIYFNQSEDPSINGWQSLTGQRIAPDTVDKGGTGWWQTSTTLETQGARKTADPTNGSVVRLVAAVSGIDSIGVPGLGHQVDYCFLGSLRVLWGSTSPS